MTQAQAEAYFRSIPPAEQQAVRASGADILAWANASENAGDPRALAHSGSRLPGAGTGDYYGGNVATGGAPSGEWAGQRKPTPAELRAYARQSGWSEDFDRFSDAQLAAWIGSSWDPSVNKFRNQFGSVVEKPTDDVPGDPTYGPDASGGGGGGGGGGGYGAGTTYGGAPNFQYTKFQPPLPSDVTLDPSYAFRVGEGRKALEHSAAARGTLRTSGTLQDILDYGQRAASEEYGNIFNRAAQTYGLQYQGEKDYFAPQYGSWQTVYGGDLSKYLAREANIFNLLNTPAPQAPYYG